MKDTFHWQNLQPPLSPNSYEVSLFSMLTEHHDNICLLGMTKQLIPLCNVAVDLYPIDLQIDTIKGDWNNITTKYDAIIGDGVLNLAGLQLVDHLLKYSNTVVCRVFLDKLPGMKYATHFPQIFPNAKYIIETQPNIVIVKWIN